MAENETAHQEAVGFVEKNRDFYEHYARGRVKFEPAPPGLDTFAFNLEADPPVIYIHSRFYKKRGLSDQKTSFGTLHEVEHLLEKKQLLAEKDGEKKFKRYLDRMKASKAFNFLDNRVSDLRENRAIVSKTDKKDGAFDQLRRSLYKEDLVPETDFTSEPRHIQFVEAISREGELPDEQCAVSPEVRVKLDEIRAITGKDGSSLLEAMTRPSTPMSERLRLQDKFLWPALEELMKQDIEDHKGKGDKGAEVEVKPQEAALDPNEIFKESYDEAARRVPNAVPLEEIEKAFNEWKDKHSEDLADKADREYAEKLGVKPGDLRRYREIVASLEKIIDPETGESIIQELKDLFAKIIAKRLKPGHQPRYPVEEGEELVHPAEAISEGKAGNLEPKVWETHEVAEIKSKRFGEVEITLVCDRSSSMAQGAKLPEQRRAAVLVMEALKEFAEQCDEEKTNVDKPLEIRSEVYSFQQDSADSIPLKKMSKNLGEKERIDVTAAISSAPGGTTDFIPLETIEKDLSEGAKQKIKEGELKKIVIVSTDGESNDSGRVRNILEKLRGSGVVAIGIGITKDGEVALTTYAPDARLAVKAEDLAIVLADLLKEHLADV